jgi:hypothetical protein
VTVMTTRDADEVLAAIDGRACRSSARALLRLTASGGNENGDDRGSRTGQPPTANECGATVSHNVPPLDGRYLTLNTGPVENSSRRASQWANSRLVSALATCGSTRADQSHAHALHPRAHLLKHDPAGLDAGSASRISRRTAPVAS